MYPNFESVKQIFSRGDLSLKSLSSKVNAEARIHDKDNSSGL